MNTTLKACMQFNCFALFVAACAITPRAAHAQEALDESPQKTLSEESQRTPAEIAEADQKARVLFTRGRLAYDSGRYRDAWDDFRNAYLLSKRPELLYNVGQAADRLRMDREALDVFRLYLKRLPNAENRREVENRIRALEEQLGDADAPTSEPTDTISDDTTSAALATPAPSQAENAAPSDGQPTRTGFYVGLGLGLGLLLDKVSNSSQNADSINSGTLGVQIALGYAVASGVVLGGGVVAEIGLSPSVTRSDITSDIQEAKLTLPFVFIDYYLSPRANGWHLLGGLGIGELEFSDPDNTIVESDGTTAGALILGGGYEWPFSQTWALGAFLRLTFMHAGQDTATHNGLVLSALFTATWY